MDKSTTRPFRLAVAMRKYKLGFLVIGLMSGFVNLLALTGSLYMLQVYDRVLASHSVQTLVGLSVILVLLYAFYGIFDLIRTRLLSRIGLKIDRSLRQRILRAVLLLPLVARSEAGGLQPIRDMDQIRGFLSGLGPTAFFDVPWLPLFLVLIYILHPALALYALIAAALLLMTAIITEVRTSGPTRAAIASGGSRMNFAEQARRNTEAIQAMGMTDRVEQKWLELTEKHLGDQLRASDAASGIGTVSKVMRTVLQSGMLGLGAYFAIQGEISMGGIIAGTIALGRALAPIDLAIQHWRGFVAARQSYARLKTLFDTLPIADERVELPRPSETLVVEGLTLAAPGGAAPILRGISFRLEAGDGLGVIGPSASGKSTLARALVGVWKPTANGGAIRLDGATLDQFSLGHLGQDIGYLPQDIELFAGTVFQNIARMIPAADSEAVIKAARLAGCHDMILALPDGYNTQIGEGGIRLSAGQRQRVALARALFGDPFLVVLDEPNSNLDATGDAALAVAIKSVRERSGVVIVIAHRPSALGSVDLLMAMAHGAVTAFGPKDEVLRQVLKPTFSSQGDDRATRVSIVGSSPRSGSAERTG